MATETRSGYCLYCQRRVAVSRPGPNHLMHLILTVLTAGAWLFVWLAVVIFRNKGWRCTQCGQKGIRQVQ